MIFVFFCKPAVILCSPPRIPWQDAGDGDVPRCEACSWSCIWLLLCVLEIFQVLVQNLSTAGYWWWQRGPWWGIQKQLELLSCPVEFSCVHWFSLNFSLDAKQFSEFILFPWNCIFRFLKEFEVFTHWYCLNLFVGSSQSNSDLSMTGLRWRPHHGPSPGLQERMTFRFHTLPAEFSKFMWFNSILSVRK